MHVHYQASTELDNDPFIWISCVGAGKHEKHLSCIIMLLYEGHLPSLFKTRVWALYGNSTLQRLPLTLIPMTVHCILNLPISCFHLVIYCPWTACSFQVTWWLWKHSTCACVIEVSSTAQTCDQCSEDVCPTMHHIELALPVISWARGSISNTKTCMIRSSLEAKERVEL